jgi:hypothetical protein
MALAGCQATRGPISYAAPPSAAAGWQTRGQVPADGPPPAVVAALPPSPTPAPIQPVAHIAQVGPNAQFTPLSPEGGAAVTPAVYQAASPRRFPPEQPDQATANLVAATHTEAQRDPLPMPPPAAQAAPAPGAAGTDGTQVIDLDPRPPVAVTPALRLVNSRRFTLGFELCDYAGALELWATPDTRTWRKHDDAQIRPGACVVEVPGEGTYGFTLVGHGGARPQAGDSPQVWVTVDTTKPTVQLHGVELSLTTRPQNLVVRWSAEDKNLGPRPITLSYAAQAQGPWMTLAANLPNTGRYEWPVPKNFPRAFFLRVEAIDLTGNAASAQTPNPIRRDNASETARTEGPSEQAPRVTNVAIGAVEPAGN